MKYQLIYSEQRKIVWTIILISLSLCGIFIAGFLSIDDIPDWVMLFLSALLIAIPTFIVIYIVKKWINIKCEVTVTQNYFQINMEKKSPLYRYQQIKVSWEQMLNFDAGSYYSLIKLANPKLDFTISHLDYEPKSIENYRDFVTDVTEKIENYNHQEKHLHLITSKSIFQSTAARVGAFLFAGILLFLTFFYIFQADYYNINGVKIIWLWFIAAPYLILVYVFRKEREI